MVDHFKIILRDGTSMPDDGLDFDLMDTLGHVFTALIAAQRTSLITEVLEIEIKQDFFKWRNGMLLARTDCLRVFT